MISSPTKQVVSILADAPAPGAPGAARDAGDAGAAAPAGTAGAAASAAGTAGAAGDAGAAGAAAPAGAAGTAGAAASAAGTAGAAGDAGAAGAAAPAGTAGAAPEAGAAASAAGTAGATRLELEWLAPVAPPSTRGAAVRAALTQARGAFLVLPAARSGWLPPDLAGWLAPLLDGRCDVVYALPATSGAAARPRDLAVCAKAFRTSLLRGIPLEDDGPLFDIEIARKLDRRDARVLPVRLAGAPAGPRLSLLEHAARLRYACSGDLYTDPGAAILDSLSVARNFNRWMASAVAPYLGSRVLEIGAGMGNLAAHLAPGRARYVATDLEAEHLARLAARLAHLPQLETGLADLANRAHLAPYANQMDTVVCLNVLEHVQDYAAGLANMFQALVPGGRAIILVPHGPALYGTLDVVLGHYRRYTHAELRKQMEAAGFRLEELLDFNRVSRPAWFVSGRILKRRGIPKLPLRVFDRTVWFWRRADRYLPWPPTSIIGIGRKP